MRWIVAILLVTGSCGSDKNVANSDMHADYDLSTCNYDQMSGSCTTPNAVTIGNCFESPRCLCVFPEATWVCCYAGWGGSDAPGLRAGDPCCGPDSTVPLAPGYPCYCDDSHHWTCPFDLGTTD